MIDNIINNSFKYVEKLPLHKFFHINTSLSYYSALELVENIAKIKKENMYINEAGKTFIGYGNAHINLPIPSSNLNVNIFETIKKRKSVRDFCYQNLSLQVFSDILFYSFGLKEPYIDRLYPSFTYPCAGGYDTLRIFLCISNVESIKNGIYVYIPKRHCLEMVKNSFGYKDYEYITASLSLSRNSCFSVHIVGDMEFISYKYCDRAYRFLNLEAGHAMQNLYLITTALKLGCVASGGFLDETFLEYLKIKNESYYMLYEAFVGYNKKV